MLAQRRLTEVQLRTRLARKGFDEGDVQAAVALCKRDGFIDDALFARLFVEGRAKALGNARLVAELVRRGINRDAAKISVNACERREDERVALAAEKLFRTRTTLSYPSAARALERLGFPSPLIYRHLRLRAQAEESVSGLP
ncbi:MAG: regulatory protein RecX [Candidatus Eremiobacteraeota bacterium]|nr:regulatory protein RecX [Candidatus Eremiobacteraeota bacterium]MBC5802063.1 regulatory protein RecX [Candidatus Eremiobacteraeota bacterium]MBC5822700.1 regulatory protein RecX [Candidatus Eremiobacteraeota bacterium]